jgi:hypothetical protein
VLARRAMPKAWNFFVRGHIIAGVVTGFFVRTEGSDVRGKPSWNTAYLVMLIVAAGLGAAGCTTVASTDADPCAGWRGGGATRTTGGSLIMADYELEIPFRVRVLDIDTGAPLSNAFAVDETHYAGDDWPEESPLGTVGDDGILQGVAWTLVGTPNPYHPCYRRRFRGILVQVSCPGYGSFRGYVPLPSSEGVQVNWGTVYLKRTEHAAE